MATTRRVTPVRMPSPPPDTRKPARVQRVDLGQRQPPRKGGSR